MYNLWYFVAFYTVLLQNLFFLAIFAVLSHDRFLRFTRYYVEKNLAKNSARGEKMTNMRYAVFVSKFTSLIVEELELRPHAVGPPLQLSPQGDLPSQILLTRLK